MITIWILWAVLTLVHPTAQVVLMMDEFVTPTDCETALKSLGYELAAAVEHENIDRITLTCIPVGTRH